MSRFVAWLGLGANLGDPEATLRQAVYDLRQLSQSRLLRLSSLYQSSPEGPEGQPDYLNAVAVLETALTPHGLLQALHAIENRHGRERQIRWGARTLDLDILLYSNDIIHTPDLIIPHAEIRHRNFVLQPLLEIWPDATLPDGELLQLLPAANQQDGLWLRHHGPSWGD